MEENFRTGLSQFRTIGLHAKYHQVAGVNVLFLNQGAQLNDLPLHFIQTVDLIVDSDGRVIKSRWGNIFNLSEFEAKVKRNET